MDTSNPFQIFGIEPAFDLDERKIQDLYYDASKKLHPDRFAAHSDALKIKSQQLSATLNQAYAAIKDKEARLESLLRMKGLIKESEKSAEQGEIPLDLADDFFELQEFIMENGNENPSQARNRIDDFRKNVSEKSKELTNTIYQEASKANWKSDEPAAFKTLLSLRKERTYLQSMIENLTRLENKLGN